MNDYQPQGLNMPPIVKNILILNIILFIGTAIHKSVTGMDLVGPLGEHFFLAPAFRIWQPITSMFMHGSVWHIAFNMFALYQFGSILEKYWGPKKFLLFYMVCGLGASVCDGGVSYLRMNKDIKLLENYVQAPTPKEFANIEQLWVTHKLPIYTEELATKANSMSSNYHRLLSEGKEDEAKVLSASFIQDSYEPEFLNGPVSIGASGAIFGLLLAFGLIFPDVRLMFIFFPVPIKAKWMVIIYGALELVSGVANVSGDNIAHFAHLGGMIFGYILMMFWKIRSKRVYH